MKTKKKIQEIESTEVYIIKPTIHGVQIYYCLSIDSETIPHFIIFMNFYEICQLKIRTG